MTNRRSAQPGWPPRTTGRRLLGAAQAATGMLLLVRPAQVLATVGAPPARPAQRITRLLGSRLLAQGVTVGLSTDRRVLWAAAAVDALHAASMVPLLASRRWRSAGLASAGVAAAGVAASRLLDASADH